MSTSQSPTGRTTRQMLDAPRGAVYVWLNSNLYYPEQLAKHLQREDLKIKPVSWLRVPNVAGLNPYEVVIDHAAHLQREFLDAQEYLEYQKPKFSPPLIVRNERSTLKAPWAGASDIHPHTPPLHIPPLHTPLGRIEFITPHNWPSDQFALLTEPQLQELRRQTELAILGEEKPLSEHARKTKQADTPHWITPEP